MAAYLVCPEIYSEPFEDSHRPQFPMAYEHHCIDPTLGFDLAAEPDQSLLKGDMIFSSGPDPPQRFFVPPQRYNTFPPPTFDDASASSCSSPQSQVSLPTSLESWHASWQDSLHSSSSRSAYDMQHSMPPVFDRLLQPYDPAGTHFTHSQEPHYIPEAGPVSLTDHSSIVHPPAKAHQQAHFHHQQRRDNPRQQTASHNPSPYPLSSQHLPQTSQPLQHAATPLPHKQAVAPPPPRSPESQASPPTSAPTSSLSPNTPYPNITTSASSRSRTYTCWAHGCCGRTFSCAENYRRHCREKELGKKVSCARCGSVFTRKSNRDAHLIGGKCGIGVGTRGQKR